jgi:hypothetical protein
MLYLLQLGLLLLVRVLSLPLWEPALSLVQWALQHSNR